MLTPNLLPWLSQLPHQHQPHWQPLDAGYRASLVKLGAATAAGMAWGVCVVLLVAWQCKRHYRHSVPPAPAAVAVARCLTTLLGGGCVVLLGVASWRASGTARLLGMALDDWRAVSHSQRQGTEAVSTALGELRLAAAAAAASTCSAGVSRAARAAATSVRAAAAAIERAGAAGGLGRLGGLGGLGARAPGAAASRPPLSQWLPKVQAGVRLRGLAPAAAAAVLLAAMLACGSRRRCCWPLAAGSTALLLTLGAALTGASLATAVGAADFCAAPRHALLSLATALPAPRYHGEQPPPPRPPSPSVKLLHYRLQCAGMRGGRGAFGHGSPFALPVQRMQLAMASAAQAGLGSSSALAASCGGAAWRARPIVDHFRHASRRVSAAEDALTGPLRCAEEGAHIGGAVAALCGAGGFAARFAGETALQVAAWLACWAALALAMWVDSTTGAGMATRGNEEAAELASVAPQHVYEEYGGEGVCAAAAVRAVRVTSLCVPQQEEATTLLEVDV
jgi:hypothetical protein